MAAFSLEAAVFLCQLPGLVIFWINARSYHFYVVYKEEFLQEHAEQNEN